MSEVYGRRLRRLRFERGQSLLAFATQLELSAALVSEVERGERIPSPETLERVYQGTHDLGLYREGIVLRLMSDWYRLSIPEELAVAMARQITRHLEVV